MPTPLSAPKRPMLFNRQEATAWFPMLIVVLSACGGDAVDAARGEYNDSAEQDASTTATDVVSKLRFRSSFQGLQVERGLSATSPSAVAVAVDGRAAGWGASGTTNGLHFAADDKMPA